MPTDRGPLDNQNTLPPFHPDPAAAGSASAPPTCGPAPATTRPPQINEPSGSRFYFLDPPAEPGDLGRVGRYRLLEVIGEGGMGVVFRGFDETLTRPVAVKVIRPEAAARDGVRRRFLGEGRKAAGIRSDHVVTVHDVGEANAAPYLVMELLAGAPLDEWAGPLDPATGRRRAARHVEVALRVARHTLRGLAAIHAAGLVHRDIKRSNLWVEEGGSGGRWRVKVIDFGIAKATDGTNLTQSGGMVGTPAYMSPEQARGQPVDARADLYSLGVVLYELLTGRPVVGFSFAGGLPPLAEAAPEVPDAVAGFVARLMAVDRDRRPPTAEAALTEAERIEQGGTRPALLPPDPRFPFLGPPARPGDLGTLGPYRVTAVLGEGGMGYVFQAADDALHRTVAVKVLKPEFVRRPKAKDRFLREGRAAAAVRSDHAVTVYGVGEADGTPYLVMELLAGAHLDDWLAARPAAGRDAARRAGWVARQVLKGLAAAHAKGLVHRDIKPANLWVEDRGADGERVKVLDFGLARVADAGGVADSIKMAGTPAYMSPEQARGDKVDARADLFSLGAVLYRVVAGASPFDRGGWVPTILAVGQDDPPPLTAVAGGVPPDFARFVARLLAKYPAARPPSAAAALVELDRVRWATGPGWPIAAVVVAAAGGGAAAAALALGRAPHPPVVASKALPDLAFVTVPAGTFRMGSPADETGRDDDEAAHDATIGKPFRLAATEVTRGQFRRFVAETEHRTAPEADGLGGWGFDPVSRQLSAGRDRRFTWKDVGFTQDDRHPVVNVTWDDAVRFADWLSIKDGRKYRLPTEAEWEHARRLGAADPAAANLADASFATTTGAPAAVGADDGHPFTAPVGTYPADRLGLRDLAGNVWEWCADRYGPYPDGPAVDPKGSADGRLRVYRGGGWDGGPRYARPADRGGAPPDARCHDLGFRLAADAD